MLADKELLVVLKAGESFQPALDRGRLIAARLGASIILIADRRPGKSSHHDWIEAIAGGLTDEGFSVDIADWQQGGLVENILRVLEDRCCGLVLKYADRSQPLAEVLYTPTDWKLLRYLPVPVLMVRQLDSWESRPLLAAVDADPDDGDHALLNRHIVRMARSISDLSSSPLHLVSAYPAPMQSVQAEQQVEASIRIRYLQYCRRLCDELAPEVADVEVAEGPAETLIPACGRKLNAGLLVMGTVARRGVRGALLGGNTAEAILARVNSDVLTLKPEGFERILDMLERSFSGAETVAERDQERKSND